MATPKGNKVRVQVLLDPEAYNAMEREVHLRYMSDSRCTISSLANEIIKSHYAILIDHGSI
tara:strand:+ start:195 stop:377 length:183 start_codon:yes stop_codon:yes gene_type:complete